MPTYQYSCTECGHFFEVFQAFSEDSLTACPECQGRLRKVFNAVGVVFKGSGFYRNDSRKQGSGDGASSNGATPATSGSTSEKKPAGAAPASSGPSASTGSSGSST